jgi:tetratricopeptide (TPR) repeat protein
MRFLPLLLLSVMAFAQHDHPVPEKLGSVDFSVSCTPIAQTRFTRGVALLHSFAYEESAREFESVLGEDSHCAMAHWGIAMSYYHQLWEPSLDTAREAKGKAAIDSVGTTDKRTPREADLISAVERLYNNTGQRTLHDRMLDYEHDMALTAARYPNDVEVQVFYALALLSTAPPTDRSHTNQKKAVAILEPIYDKYPQHPGTVHYLIHAYDNSEMAAKGIKVAREYSQIAPSAPHALHMPSHIFTREGMWTDSVQSNLAARKAARDHNDIGEELHSMDYLTYAYLQLGDYDNAAAILRDLRQLTNLQSQQFKVGYAATAMPVRYAVERKKWRDAAVLPVVENAPPQVTAISIWARAVGFARDGNTKSAMPEQERLIVIERKLRENGNVYWADQVKIQMFEANGWILRASGDTQGAVKQLTIAANLEDSIEKLPLTPGPIVPAREQLAELLLLLKQPADALREFERSLQESPGRRNALQGALAAAQAANLPDKVAKYRVALK